MTAPTATPGRYLGKLAAVEDARTLQVARYLTGPTLPEPPKPPFTLAGGVTFGMFGNDVAGDCAIVAPFNLIRTDVWNAREQVAALSTEQAIAIYSRMSGYDPATGAHDVGLVELDVLKVWRKSGLAGHTIEAFAAVDVGRRRLVQQAIALFGGLYVGAELPISAQAENEQGQTWRLHRGPDGKPGSWGGHAMAAIGYTSVGVWLVTWGGLQLATWSWWMRYVSEAYAVLTADWLDEAGRSPDGFDVPALRRDLQLVA